MKLVFALAVLATIFGAGLLAEGRVLIGLLLLAPALAFAVFCGVHLVTAVRARRAQVPPSARVPHVDGPGVAAPRRLAGVLALVLAVVPLACTVGLLVAFGRMVLDPGLEPVLRGASAAAGLFLAGIPGTLGGRLLVSGVALLRRDVSAADSIDGLAKVTLGLAGVVTALVLLEGRPPSELPYDRPSVILIGIVTVVLAGAVLAVLLWFDRAMAATHGRAPAPVRGRAPADPGTSSGSGAGRSA